MLLFIITVIKLLVILCIVATIHEFGHFLAAKLFKIDVKEFSIGFGPKIFQKKWKETLYSLRWIPLGGYVSIEGEDEESNSPNSFSKKHPLKRIVVLVMGVIFNFILAAVILISISFAYPTYNTKITELTENSPLYSTNFEVGDKITEINGNKVSLVEQLLDTRYAEESEIQVRYEKDGKSYTEVVNGAIQKVGFIGVAFRSDGRYPKVDMVRPGKVAEKAGLKDGDEITAINGITVTSSDQAVSMIKQNAEKEIIVTLIRNGETKTINMVPEQNNSFDLGIKMSEKVNTTIGLAIDKAVYTTLSVINSYVDLFRGKVSLDDVSSIIGVGVVVSKTEGILEYLNLLAIVSLAIGAANILPFPPLDGGKIVLVAIEGITKKKIPLKVEAILSYIGFGLLILLTIVVMFKDIIRLF